MSRQKGIYLGYPNKFSMFDRVRDLFIVVKTWVLSWFITPPKQEYRLWEMREPIFDHYTSPAAEITLQ